MDAILHFQDPNHDPIKQYEQSRSSETRHHNQDLKHLRKFVSFARGLEKNKEVRSINVFHPRLFERGASDASGRSASVEMLTCADRLRNAVSDDKSTDVNSTSSCDTATRSSIHGETSAALAAAKTS